MTRTRRRTLAAATLVAVTALAACSGGGDDGGGGGGDGGDGGGDAAGGESIVLWTADNLPDRVAATEDIIAAFTEETGIEVELVGVAEDQFNQLLTSAAAAGW